jgi:GH43 family beta-xylosidase
MLLKTAAFVFFRSLLKNTRNKMKQQFWIYSLLLIFTIGSCKKPVEGGGTPPVVDETTFTNPLLNSGPDPWVIQQGEMYYYTHTLGNRIAIWRTSKMSDLKKVNPQTIWSAPATGPNSKNVWAPEIHFLNNKWYAYYAADDGNNANHRMYVLENTSSDPVNGTWVSKGKITDLTDKWAIDGTVLEHNGNMYFLWSGWEGNVDVQQNIYIAKMSNPWTIEGDRVLLSAPTYDWEKIGTPDVNEAPQILKNNAGRIFMTYSASGCWTDDYSLGLLTLKDGGNPLSPADWTKSPAPVFTKKPLANAYGPGHNAFFKSKDGTEDWIIYHANSQPDLQCSNNRSPRMQKFTWNVDGTPSFGEPVSTNTQLKKPSGE